mmetsp:Transcript_23427/g.52025  ORF Transcript_23427/g.52025 Transcript_23427/m.52025 type:complete len:217 (+) Transcript_23427:172-822(+)
MPHTMLSERNSDTSPQALMSKKRQVVSSEPVPKLLPSGNSDTELMSLSCPLRVIVHRPVRMSQTLARLSQLPDTNIFGSTDGSTESDITSPSCSLKVTLACPNSISHSMQVWSPEAVRMPFSPTKRQQLRYPSCAASSLKDRKTCGWFSWYMEHRLSSPPQATNPPFVCSNAHVITQLDLSGIACNFVFPMASQTINLPSWEALTRSFELPDQCIA